MKLKWKPKMKLRCPECGKVSKHIIQRETDYSYGGKCHKIKCGNPSCKEEQYATIEYIKEMESAANVKK